jgi:hypothetical protein
LYRMIRFWRDKYWIPGRYQKGASKPCKNVESCICLFIPHGRWRVLKWEKISTLRQTSPKGNGEMDTGTARGTWRKGNLTDIVEPRTLRRCRGSLVVLSLSTRNRKVGKMEIMTEDVALRYSTLANVESSETAFAGDGDECAFRLVHPANCCVPGPDPIGGSLMFHAGRCCRTVLCWQ